MPNSNLEVKDNNLLIGSIVIPQWVINYAQSFGSANNTDFSWKTAVNNVIDSIVIPPWIMDYAQSFGINTQHMDTAPQKESPTLYQLGIDTHIHSLETINRKNAESLTKIEPSKLFEFLPAISIAPTIDSYPVDELKDRFNGNTHFEKMVATVNSMAGSPITKFDHRTIEDLGCANFTSYVLRKVYNLPITDVKCANLENTLLTRGWKQVSREQAQPGDVIVAYHASGNHGHSAIYFGKGEDGKDKIANNSSLKTYVCIDDCDKFERRDNKGNLEYKTVFFYHKDS